MKKNLLTVLTLLAFTITGLAQGINFEHGDWTDVKEKAKKEDKIIFIDFYTSWCGPCKKLAKTVFPQKEVGDFYNKNFINYKVDAEKGVGVELSKQYEVNAFPTLLFVDFKGKILHQDVGGMSVEEFIALGKTAMDPSKRIGELLTAKVSKKNMPGHLREMNARRLPLKKDLVAYIESLSSKKLYSKETYELLLDLKNRGTEDYISNLISKNRKKYSAVVGEQTLSNWFYQEYLMKIYAAKRKQESTEAIYDEIKENGFDFEEKIKATVKLSGIIYEYKFDEFLKEAPLYIEKFAKDDNYTKYSVVFSNARKFVDRSDKIRQYAYQLADEFIADNYKVNSIYSFLGYQSRAAGDFEKSLGYYQKAAEYAKQNKLDDGVIQQYIGDVKHKIEIYEKGDYTYHISGLDAFNGLEFCMLYSSPTEIGKFHRTERVLVKDGKCTITGNVKTPTPVIWSVNDGDYLKSKGKMILEPGEYNVKYTGGYMDAGNAWYNFYLYKALYMHPKFKEVKASGGRKVQEFVEGFYKQNYFTNPDPKVKILSFYLSNLKFKDNAKEEIEKMRKLAGDHYLLETLLYNIAESEKRRRNREAVSVGKKIIPFKARDLEGNEFHLLDVFKEKEYVLLEFWASWCKSCRSATPHLKELYSKYKDKGFEIVSFSLDHKEHMWKRASEEDGIPWTNTSDLVGWKSPIVQMYGVSGVPASLLVDKNGVIVGKYLGDGNLDEKLKEIFESK